MLNMVTFLRAARSTAVAWNGWGTSYRGMKTGGTRWWPSFARANDPFTQSVLSPTHPFGVVPSDVSPLAVPAKAKPQPNSLLYSHFCAAPLLSTCYCWAILLDRRARVRRRARKESEAISSSSPSSASDAIVPFGSIFWEATDVPAGLRVT